MSYLGEKSELLDLLAIEAYEKYDIPKNHKLSESGHNGKGVSRQRR
jgi:hypothetical protein